MFDTSYLFPPPEFREFDATKLIGTKLKLTLTQNTIRNNEMIQYIYAHTTFDERADIHYRVIGELHGLIPPIREKYGKITVAIDDMWLTPHRDNPNISEPRYSSYREFYNDDVKVELQTKYDDVIQCHTVGDANYSTVDVVVKFTYHKKQHIVKYITYDLYPPEEWYSETRYKLPAFKFKSGFYHNAAHAIRAFENEPTDDMFGTRYFPVIVIPLEKINIAREIARSAKNCSSPVILSSKNLVAIGTRCKPEEYPDIISETYKFGGKIPIGVIWSHTWEDYTSF